MTDDKQTENWTITVEDATPAEPTLEDLAKRVAGLEGLFASLLGGVNAAFRHEFEQRQAIVKAVNEAFSGKRK